MDLLTSLKAMETVTNSKKKTESLENELLKIDNELFELEKKYGEFKVRKASTFQEISISKQENADSSSSSNE